MRGSVLTPSLSGVKAGLQPLVNLAPRMVLFLSLSIVFCFYGTPGNAQKLHWILHARITLAVLWGTYRILGMESKYTKQAAYPLYYFFSPWNPFSLMTPDCLSILRE